MQRVVSIAAVLVLGLFGHGAFAQGAASPIPSGTVRIIVPYPAGGSFEVAGRHIVQRLPELTGNAAFLENKPGASGTIGTFDLVRAAPNGLTLALLGTGNVALNPFMQKAATYDPQADLVPVSLTTIYRFVLAVHPSFPARDVPELIAYLKANPGKVDFGSAGVGTTQHLAAALFEQVSGTRMHHIPYAGAPRVLPALMNNEVQLAFLPMPDATPFAASGRIRLLGVTSTDRAASMPDLKTIAEQGLPDYRCLGWVGLFLPKGTPAAIVARYNAIAREVLNNPAVRSQAAAANLELTSSTVEEARAFIAQELKRWPPVIKSLGIEPT